MDTRLILDIVLIVFSIIIGTLLSMVLYHALIILRKVEVTFEYIDHVRRIFQMWERIPFDLMRKFSNFWSK